MVSASPPKKLLQYCFPRSEVLKLDDATMPVKQDYKSLGETFDTKLNFLAHINTKKIKANESLNILKVLTQKHWGSARTCLHRIYWSLAFSTMVV